MAIYSREFRWSTIVSALIALLPGRELFAFDSGHHQDQTSAVLQEASFQPSALRTVMVANWLTDYYASRPTIPEIENDVKDIRVEMEKMHFDNLFTMDRVRSNWAHLTANTKAGMQKAAKDNDPLRGLAILGMTLHAVQDFYSHSNWVEKHPRPAGGPYRTETWFDDLKAADIFTGYTGPPDKRPAEARDVHGGYDDGMNHDSYIRARWDEAYIFAYTASVQWVEAVHQWVNEADPKFWASLQNYGGYTGLDRDMDAVYRMSEWLDAGGHNGSWKGPGSGHSIEFVPFAGKWILSRDSNLVTKFKDPATYRPILVGLAGEKPAPLAIPVGKISAKRKAVVVGTVYLKDKGHVDRGPQKDADFFARVNVGGQEFVEAMQLDKAEVKPLRPTLKTIWITIKLVSADTKNVPIHYALIDEDGGLGGEDDPCDINPNKGSDPNNRDLNFTLSLADHVCAGDVAGKFDTPEMPVERQGQNGDTDAVIIRLYVTVRDVGSP